MSCGCNGKPCGMPFDADAEAPSAADVARFGGDGEACPACGADVYHDAALCGSCGYALLDDEVGEGATWSKGPVVIGAAVLALAGFVLVSIL